MYIKLGGRLLTSIMHAITRASVALSPSWALIKVVITCLRPGLKVSSIGVRLGLDIVMVYKSDVS